MLTLFIRRTLVFLLTALVVYLLIYWAYYKLTTPKEKNAVYVWGDSQMMQGIDLKQLDENTPFRFYSAAQHGAGLYDFLVFTQMVPENSRVFIQISEPALLRRKKVDRNLSAINLVAIRELYLCHYRYPELWKILVNNIQLSHMFATKNILFGDADTIKWTEPISLFTESFGHKPEYLEDKEGLQLWGLRQLKRKHCLITAIIFPYCPILDSIRERSPYFSEISSFRKEVGMEFARKDTIKLDCEKNMFYDLTHLNCRGADLLGGKLQGMIHFDSTDAIIEVSASGKHMF